MPGLARRLGTADAVVIGLGSMIGAGVFSAFAPAAAAAGSALLIGLALAAVVAYCNATGVRAARGALPDLGRHLRLRAGAARRVVGLPRRLGLRGRQDGVVRRDGADLRGLRAARDEPWLPARSSPSRRSSRSRRVNLRGITRTASAGPHPGGRLARRAGAFVVAVPWRAAVPTPATSCLGDGRRHGPYGVLQSAGLLFFAFAGYARIATMGEEVRDPQRTIPRAIPLALGITVARLPLVGDGGARSSLGPAALAAGDGAAGGTRRGGRRGVGRAGRPGRRRGRRAWVRCSRSSPASAGRRSRWRARATCRAALAAVHPRYQVPHRAEVAVAVAVVALVVARRPARRHRLLLVRRPDLLRDRERRRLDPAAGGSALAARLNLLGLRRLPGAGRDTPGPAILAGLACSRSGLPGAECSAGGRHPPPGRVAPNHRRADMIGRDESALHPDRRNRVALLHRCRAGGIPSWAPPLPGADQRGDVRDPARGGRPAGL